VIAGLVVALSSVVMWQMLKGPQIRVDGNLSREDVDEVKRVVRREAWRRAFPDFSWSTIKEVPGKLKPIEARIYYMSVLDNGQVFVNTTTERGANIEKNPTYFYTFAKKSNGWRCVSSGIAGPIRVDIKPSRAP
jgi:hypothetical protein